MYSYQGKRKSGALNFSKGVKASILFSDTAFYDSTGNILKHT